MGGKEELGWLFGKLPGYGPETPCEDCGMEGSLRVEGDDGLTHDVCENCA